MELYQAIVKMDQDGNADSTKVGFTSYFIHVKCETSLSLFIYLFS